MSNPPETSAELLERLQHQVALFARRAEQTRLGGVGKARNSMDRAAYLLLNRLDREGPMGVKALAEAMGIDSSTVTRQVAPLVDSGLVKRTSHPEDGRAVVLALSPRGRGRLDEVRDSRRALMAEVTAEWTGQERELFTDLLVRFNTSLSEWHAGLGQREGQPAEPVPAEPAAEPTAGSVTETAAETAASAAAGPGAETALEGPSGPAAGAGGVFGAGGDSGSQGDAQGA
ncbi:DNA-binding transcriptional regulator, MarR family [Streptomyces sp. DvalAA-14]|nr:DNA-binding transcriptional regulator, MarR family [Streptomyces sp. DvalAA-14]